MLWEIKLTIPLMEQVAEYFERKNNIPELAKTYHNLGTDLLYLGDSKNAIIYLNQAINELQKYGSDEIHYTYNCIGVYYAAYESNFEKAIEYFQRAISFKPVLFSTMVLYLNLSSCYKALQNDEESKINLESAMQIRAKLGNDVLSYSLYLLINQGLHHLYLWQSALQNHQWLKSAGSSGLSSKVYKFYKISLPAVFKAAGFTCRISTAHT